MSPSVVLVNGIGVDRSWLVASPLSESSTPPSMPSSSFGEMLPKSSRSIVVLPIVASSVVTVGAAGAVSSPKGAVPVSPMSKVTVAEARSWPETSWPGSA